MDIGKIAHLIRVNVACESADSYKAAEAIVLEENSGLGTRPGLYRHYKGDHYRLLFLAQCVERTQSDFALLPIISCLSEKRDVYAICYLDGETGQLAVVPESPHPEYEEGTEVVLYMSLKKRVAWVRPLRMWNEQVEWLGKLVPRFQYVGDSL